MSCLGRVCILDQTIEGSWLSDTTQPDPGTHAREHSLIDVPPVQNEVAGHALHTLFEKFVHGVVSYVVGLHTGRHGSH